MFNTYVCVHRVTCVQYVRVRAQGDMCPIRTCACTGGHVSNTYVCVHRGTCVQYVRVRAQGDMVFAHETVEG